MRNMWRIFRDDMKRLFSNTVCIIITLGLILIPSIFSWYNVIACWNAFDNTGNLMVAVANCDEGYKSDIVPIDVNIGEKVVSALRANDQIHWVFTSEDDAVEGARSGRYYAAVVIPQNFSRDMLTFYSDDMKHAQIIYYSNEKKSAVAPKITDQGADTVSYQVNEVFAETMAEVALGVAQSVSQYAEDSDVQGDLGRISQRVREVGDGLLRTKEVLALYSRLVESAQGVVSGSVDLLHQAQGSVDEAKGPIEQSISSASSMADVIKGAAGNLSGALDGASGQMDAVSAAADTAFDAAVDDVNKGGDGLKSLGQQVGDAANRYRDLATQLSGFRDQLPEEQRPALDAAVTAMNNAADQMTAAGEGLGTAGDQLKAGATNVDGSRDQVKAQIADAKNSLAQAKDSYEKNMKPQLQQLADQTADAVNRLQVEDGKLADAVDQLSTTADSANATMSDASKSIEEACAKLETTADQLRQLADQVDSALASGDMDQLRQILGGDAKTLAQALAAPVSLDRQALYPVENFGSAMAPFYTTLGLFIGSLLILVTVKPALSRKQEAGLVNPKPRQLFLGRFLTLAFLSLAQTTVMGLGNIFFLDVQHVHPLLLMLVFWAAGLVFTFIIYALVATFANLGKAIAVLLLIVQVTGCGGSFPLQILPQFVQALSPWLPATHVVNAMRAAMMGTTGMDYWYSMGLLALFLVPAAILGLGLRKPLSKLMHWYIEKVESSGLVA